MNKRILIFGNYPPPFGGIPSHLESLCPFLVENGWQVHVVSGGKGGVVKSDEGIAVYKLSIFRVLMSPSQPFKTIRVLLNPPFVGLLRHNLKMWLRLFVYISIGRKLLDRNRIDLISAYNLINYGAVAAILSREYRIPLVVTNFGEIYSERLFLLRHLDIVDFICDTANKLLAMSHHCANSYYLLDRDPDVTVVPYGVDTERFNTTIDIDVARRELGITQKDPLVLLYLGRMNRDMGLHIFLQAIPELLDRSDSVRVLIAGERGELTDDADRIGQSHRDRVLVEERVPYDRLEAYYAAASIVVVPTIGMRACGSLTSIEAMACGKPVVGSCVGGIPEIIIDGVTGVLIPPEDPRAMSRAIEDLSNDVNLMSGMGALGRQRALQHFSQSTTNGQIGMIFQTAC